MNDKLRAKTYPPHSPQAPQAPRRVPNTPQAPKPAPYNGLKNITMAGGAAGASRSAKSQATDFGAGGARCAAASGGAFMTRAARYRVEITPPVPPMRNR
jgi:hypothetical protein